MEKTLIPITLRPIIATPTVDLSASVTIPVDDIVPEMPVVLTNQEKDALKTIGRGFRRRLRRKK